MEPFFKSDLFWLTIPFLTDEQRVPWISRCAGVQVDAPHGTVVTMDKFKIVYVQQASPEMIMEAHQADIIFDFTKALHANDKVTTKYSTVNYPGKNRLRWIYPLTNKRPSFLHFYYLDSACSKIAALLFSIVFHLKRWTKKHSFTLHTRQQPLPEQTLRSLTGPDGPADASGYSIRIGARGTDRSLVVAYERGTRSIAFGKYATNHTSLGNLDHERKALQEIYTACNFQAPAVIKAENSLLIMSSVRPDHVTQESTLPAELVHGLINFYKDSTQISTLQEIMPWNQVRAEATTWARDARVEVKMAGQWLLRFMDTFEPARPIAVSVAHGDLTPWNLYRGKKHFHIFDWELYARQQPLLFDFFHYILQKNIYSGKGSSDDVRRELKGLKTHPDVLSLLARHQTSWEECLHNFLVVQTPYFLKQHVQAAAPILRETRRLQILTEFLKEAIQLRSITSRSEEFYAALENHLNHHHQYALMLFFQSSLQDLPAAQQALTMALPLQSLDRLVTFLESHTYVSAVDRKTSGPASKLTIAFTDGNALVFHCLHRFHQKGLCYLSIDDLLRCRVTNGKRYVASLFFDFSYYVIKQTLNHATTQNDMLQRFEQRVSDEHLQTIWTSTKNFWMNNNSAQHQSIATNVKKYIHALPMNKFTSRIAYRINDLKGLFRFPKVALPTHQNHLAPVPATTRTRRLH